MSQSTVTAIAPLALAVLPGLHYDLLRCRANGRGPCTTATRLGRVVMAGTLVTTITLLVLEALHALGPDTLVGPEDLLGGGLAPGGHPPLGVAWSLVGFIGVSLTMASLAAAGMARLEGRAAALPLPPRPDPLAHAEHLGRDVELEVRLHNGDTYRGTFAGAGTAGRDRDRYITLNGPIFELDGHDRPLPLDALHWSRLVVPTSAVMSVLARPIDAPAGRPPAPEGPPVPGAPPSRSSRHATRRPGASARVRAFAGWCYAKRFDPGVLARLLGVELVLIGLVAVVTRAL